jgi:hypothetical protein
MDHALKKVENPLFMTYHGISEEVKVIKKPVCTKREICTPELKITLPNLVEDDLLENLTEHVKLSQENSKLYLETEENPIANYIFNEKVACIDLEHPDFDSSNKKIALLGYRDEANEIMVS